MEHPDGGLLRVLAARGTVIDSDWRYSLRNPFWRIYCNGDSGAEVVHPGGVFELTPGLIHVLPAWGTFSSRCTRSLSHAYMHVDPGEPLRALPVRPDLAGSALARPWTLPPDPALVARFRAVCADVAPTVLWRMRAQAVALTVLVTLLELVPQAVREGLEQGPADDAVERARRWIDMALPGPLPVEALARDSGLSPSYFAKVFRMRTGMAPRSYVQERRIALAAERLLAGNEDIERVATECGFANRFHFSRVFTRRMGVGPAAYRKAGRVGVTEG